MGELIAKVVGKYLVALIDAEMAKALPLLEAKLDEWLQSRLPTPPAPPANQ